MENEILYMLGIVGIGFAVNYTLRALPFLLFAGRNREQPIWLARLGNVISPVIIAALIVYSYSGLAWKTPWPYVAGVTAVALELLFRNPLVSIVAGTALYMCLLTCGCATTGELKMDGAHPAVAITDKGIRFNGKLVMPEEVPELLEKHNVPKNATIHILVEDENVNQRIPWVFQHNILGKAGYTRTVLVTERRAESKAGNDVKNASQLGKRVIPYRPQAK